MVSPVATQLFPNVHRANPTPLPAKTVPAAASNSVQATAQVGVTQVEIRSQSVSHGSTRVEGVEAYRAVESRDAANPFASTILNFIEIQLQRDLADGASPEELASRLQAGLKGFEEGYGQAYEQLASSGFLDDGIKAEIEQTHNQVLAGIRKLADELGVEIDLPEAGNVTPQPAEVILPSGQLETSPESVMHPGKSLLSAVLRDVQIIEQYQKMSRAEATYTNPAKARSGIQSAAVSYAVRESRDFSLKLRTADGDAVTIRFGNEKSGASAVNADRTSLSVWGSQSSSLQFSVEGELDEDEMRALTDLLGQVAEISEQFFAGDLEAAFQLASELAFDQSEISSFDIRWNMSRTEVAETSAQNSNVERSAHSYISPADKFVASIMRAADVAERLGQPRSLVADLLDWVAQNNHQQDARNALLAPAARAFL